MDIQQCPLFTFDGLILMKNAKIGVHTTSLIDYGNYLKKQFQLGTYEVFYNV